MAIYSGFSHKKIVIFHSYVKLPEGTWKNIGKIKHIPNHQPDIIHTSHRKKNIPWHPLWNRPMVRWSPSTPGAGYRSSDIPWPDDGRHGWKTWHAMPYEWMAQVRKSPITFQDSRFVTNVFRSHLVGGWQWLTYPLKNDGLKVSWDDEIPNWMESHKIPVPNHQPVILYTIHDGLWDVWYDSTSGCLAISKKSLDTGTSCPPSCVCWFINPKYTGYVHQLSYPLGPLPCRPAFQWENHQQITVE